MAKHQRSVQRRTRPAKPSKPYKGFPLTAHPSGQWCKKVRGRIHYFGVWDDPEGARDKWLAEKDHLLAGMEPQPRAVVGISVGELCDEFTAAKQAMVETGEMSVRTLADYQTICQRVCKVFNRHMAVADLKPADFGRLRRNFAKTHGPVSLSSDITRTKVLFNWGHQNEIFDNPVKYGSQFDKPSRTCLRKARQARGKRMYEAAQIRAMLAAADPNLRAMIYLGLNCGFGNADCARLTFDRFDQEHRWVEYPREKTGIPRRARLWPETKEALDAAIEQRPTPQSKEHQARVFINAKRNSYDPKSKNDMDNLIATQTTNLIKELGFHRPGLSFYALRHTFQTIGQRCDKDATRYIMGHAEAADDMGQVYNEERPSDRRLLKVAKYVRKWLKQPHARDRTPQAHPAK